MSKVHRYNSLPGPELFDSMPAALPCKEMLTHLKAGPLVLMYRRLFRKLGVEPRGVVHLGGHLGQEAVPYLLLGYARAIFVEPDPRLFKELQQNLAFVDKLARFVDRFAEEPDQRWGQAIHAAVGDHDGVASLHVQPNHTQENSILKPIAGSHPKLEAAAEVIEVPMRTLDSLLSSELADGWKPEDFNVLYINVEGAELLALRGALSSLKHFEFAFLEVNQKPHYEGNPTASDLEDFMDGHGFALRWACAGFAPDTGYLVFTRKS